MKTVIKWVLGISFCLVGFGRFTTGGVGILAGILNILAGLICLPPTLAVIETELNTIFSRTIKYVIVISCWLLAIAIDPKDKTTKSETAKADTNSLATTEKLVNEYPQKKLKEQIERELSGDAFIKGLKTDTYKGSIEAVQMELILFSVWANIIKEGESSVDDQNKKLASTLRKKVLALQISEFPKMRKAYIDVVADKLWEENITVTAQGNGNTVVNITGGIFVNNKNKKQMQETLSDVLKSFRFKQVRYRWYKDEDEYTYYDLSVPKDNELVEFSK